jgi:hypothetical protein
MNQIELVQIWTIEGHDAKPCAMCQRAAPGIQGFEFQGQLSERVCQDCAIETGFTIRPELLQRVLSGFRRTCASARA